MGRAHSLPLTAPVEQNSCKETPECTDRKPMKDSNFTFKRILSQMSSKILRQYIHWWITLAYSDRRDWVVRKNQVAAWEKRWDCPALWYHSLNQLAVTVEMFFQLCWHNSLWGCTVRLITVSWWKMIINSVTQFIATNNCKSTTQGVESSSKELRASGKGHREQGSGASYAAFTVNERVLQNCTSVCIGSYCPRCVSDSSRRSEDKLKKQQLSY